MVVGGAIRTRWRPKRMWVEAVGNDMMVCDLANFMTLKRDEWRRRVCVVDPKPLGFKVLLRVSLCSLFF